MASFTELGAVQSNLVDRDFRASAMAQQLPGLNAFTTTKSDSDAAIRDYRKKLKDSKTSWSDQLGFERNITDKARIGYQRGGSTFEGPDGQLRGAPTALLQQLDYAEAMGIPSYGLENIYKQAPKGMYASYAQADKAFADAAANPFFQGQGAFDKVQEAKKRTEELQNRSQAIRSGGEVFKEVAGGPTGNQQAQAVELDLQRAREAERRARKSRRDDLIAVQGATTKAFKEAGRAKAVFANVPIKETIQQSPLNPKRR